MGRHVRERGGHIAATGVHIRQVQRAEVALRVLHRGLTALHAEHARAFGGHRGQRQREQSGTGIQVPYAGGGHAVKRLVR